MSLGRAEGLGLESQTQPDPRNHAVQTNSFFLVSENAAAIDCFESNAAVASSWYLVHPTAPLVLQESVQAVLRLSRDDPQIALYETHVAEQERYHGKEMRSVFKKGKVGAQETQTTDGQGYSLVDGTQPRLARLFLNLLQCKRERNMKKEKTITP